MATNYLIEQSDGWYFLDETGNTDGNGPYKTKEEANLYLNQYCHFLNTGKVVAPEFAPDVSHG